MTRSSAELILLAALILFGPAPTTFALSTDADQPIYIEADFADMNRGSGVTVYRGRVKVSQGSRRLWGDLVRIYTDEDDQITSVVAEGQPARLRQKPDSRKECVWGEGNRIEYFADEERMYLYEDARIWQGQNVMTSQTIIYDAKQDQLIGGEEGSSDKRVRIVTMPRREGDTDAGQASDAVDPFSCEQPPIR
jgi:lipopolysaccharide export system protein LptA